MVLVPELFMSANWSSEVAMNQLFVTGIQGGVKGFDTAREYKVERKVGRALAKVSQRQKRVVRIFLFNPESATKK